VGFPEAGTAASVGVRYGKDASGSEVASAAMSPSSASRRPWTTLGTVGAPGRAVVDRRGRVTPEGAGFSIDWWAGADDRWHTGADAAVVRQSLVDSVPVLLTSMRIPEGELEQRAWAVAGPDSGGGVLVVELHNASPVPVAVAFAIGPEGPDGPTAITSIDLDGSDVLVDGRVAFVVQKRPSRFAVGSAALGDAYDSTVDGSATAVWPAGGVRCEAGRASAALIFPLPHTASLRIAIPLGSSAVSMDLARQIDVGALPDSDRVARGWRAQTARAPRFEIPERRVAEATAAARCHLLMHVAGQDPLRWPGVAVDDLDRAESARVLRASVDLQAANGSFGENRIDATAAWLVALGRHTALSVDSSLADESVAPIAAASHWLHRRQVGSRLRPSTAFFGAGRGADAITARVVGDASSTARALDAATTMLRVVDQSDAAAQVGHHSALLATAMRERDLAPVDDLPDLARLRSMLDAGDPTWTWPSEDTSDASAVDGHDPAQTASFLRLVRSLLVVERDDGLSMLPVVPPTWLGQPIEVHDLPTSFGTLSFAVRWHGARPALLWDLDATDAAAILTSPGLDPGWSSSEVRGEALLAEPPSADAVLVRPTVAESVPDAGGSFS
jgi:hypothetical protein